MEDEWTNGGRKDKKVKGERKAPAADRGNLNAEVGMRNAEGADAPGKRVKVKG